MASNLPGSARQFGVALRALLFFTVVLGLGYPLVMTDPSPGPLRPGNRDTPHTASG